MYGILYPYVILGPFSEEHLQKQYSTENTLEYADVSQLPKEEC